ncbi:MAG TPA: thioesterase family protein [Trueperaceae bacterium]|nr:thioesterase family protein [Trueperaceae bacterium]
MLVATAAGEATAMDAHGYFVRTGEGRYTATSHVGGAWFVDEQHIAPLLGLLTHLVEVDRDARRTDGLVITRLSFDILGRVGLDEVSTRVGTVRPGRSVELIEAVASQYGRDVVILRAWLMKPAVTADIAGTALSSIARPEEAAPFDPTKVWPGKFIESIEVRRLQADPGRALVWARTPLQLIVEEPHSRFAATVGLLDIANGMTVRADPAAVAFPNVDLTLHLFRQPEGEWVGFDTTVTFGAGGVGVTSSVIHDRAGPVAVMAQSLTIRPGV